MYQFYFDSLSLPVTPDSMEVKINGQNTTVSLLNQGEVNLLKQPGLSEISFSFLIPQVSYGGFPLQQKADAWLQMLEERITSRQPFQFIVYRTTPNGWPFFTTDMKVSLESYELLEDASQTGMDVKASVHLKQYRDFATKVLTVQSNGDENVATVSEERSTDGHTVPSSYTVVSGDSLWAIAARILGDGSRWKEIYTLNESAIEAAAKANGRDGSDTGQWIYPGTTLSLPS